MWDIELKPFFFTPPLLRLLRSMCHSGRRLPPPRARAALRALFFFLVAHAGAGAADAATHLAAVDEEVRCIAVRGLLRGKKQRRIGDFARGADATHDDVLDLERLPLIKGPAVLLALDSGYGRFDSARAHRVRTDAILGKIERGIACHLNDGALHRRVRRAVGLRDERRNASLPDDARAAAALHRGQQVLG